MQIKQQALNQHLKNKIAPLYCLLGQDNYLIEDCLKAIKTQIKVKHDVDEKIINIQSTDDWLKIKEETSNYSLFSDSTLLQLVYEKKSLDATGKKILNEYLQSINTKCFIIIKAPNIPAKQLQWLTQHAQGVLVVSYPLNAESMKQWIKEQFHKNQLDFEPNIAELIYQYTQGNMLACAQAIEKISLCYDPGTRISKQQALEHLFNQCEHSLYDLVEICLLGQADRSIQIIRQMAQSKTEATLVLWMLTQEVRTLMQLHFLLQQNIDVASACSQLKIWSQRVSLYRSCIKRFNKERLQVLLNYCLSIDEQIKSHLNSHMWDSLELLALGLCTGTLLCTP